MRRQVDRARRYAAVGMIASGLGLASVVPLGFAADGAPGTVSGTIFRDPNGNGVRDAGEAAQPGIVVTATSSTGASASAAAGADGRYSIDLGALGAGPFRVELGDLPAPLHQGPVGSGDGASATSVRVVASGGVANFAVANPAEYCQANPRLVTACFSFGGFPSSFDVVSFRNNAAGSDADTSTPAKEARTELANQGEVGSVNGAAYQRSSRTQFFAAYVKHYTPLGSGGPGGIYRIAPGADGVAGTADDVPSLYIDLNSVVPGNPAGTLSRPPMTTEPQWRNDPVWDEVGKVGLGDIEFSEDGRYLFVVSLGDRKLYRIDTRLDPTLAPTAAQVQGFSIPTPASCSSGDLRPMGLGVSESGVYVGAVCSGESSNARADLRASVFRFDTASNTFAAAPVLDASLGFERGCASPYLGTCPSPAIQKFWNPWRSSFDLADYAQLPVPISAIPLTYLARPTPILSDIQFAGGSMMLGFRDRAGDQLGYLVNSPYLATSSGDVLRACQSGSGTWQLESNGASPAGCEPAFSNAAGAGTAQGPGGGEFYSDERSGTAEQETAQGGMVYLPSTNSLAVTSLDPLGSPLQGGVRWYDQNTGRLERIDVATSGVGSPAGHAYQLFDAQADGVRFGKANGLGDLEALCDEAPLEIGNLVWFDADRDGIQDPDEAGIPGVTVDLLDGSGDVVATAITAADGTYLFLSDTAPNLPASPDSHYGVVAGGLATDTAYRLRFDRSTADLSGLPGVTVDALTRTATDAGAVDAIDSDAVDDGGADVIDVVTGAAGANDHTFDVGYHVAETTTTTSSTSTSTSTSTTSSTSTTTTSPATTTPATVLGSTTIKATTTTVKSSGGGSSLATTGASSVTLTAAGLALLLGGVYLLIVGRRLRD